MNDLPALTEVPQRLDRADFFEMTGLQERETLDFKRALDKGDQKHVAAMSMTNGGWLVVGVDDDGSLVGWDLTQPRRDLVRHQISESVNVDVSVREIRVDEIAITIVAVPEVRDRIVTTSDGRLLRRRGSASVPLRGEDLARFVRERSTTSAEETEILFDAERLSWRAVQDVLDAADRAFEREDPVRALIDLGVAERRPGDPRGTVLRLAGLLAFGSDPTTEVPGARVEFVRRSGRGGVDAPVVRRESFIGPIIDVADATVDAVMGELPSFETVVGRRRVRTPLIPEAVLREAILNGLAHRDYGLENATVDVTMTDETVSVQSPGPLPGHVTVDNIRDEHYSRNPRLMTVLKAALVVEEFGDGVDRMFDQMAERLLPEPEYVATSSSVTVTLRATSALPIEDQAWLGMFSDLDLDRDDRRVLLLVRRDGAATRRAVRALEPTREAASILRSMVDRGFLEPKGTRGGKHYVLSDEIRTRVGDSGIAAQRARRERVVSELRRAGTTGVSTREAATMLGDDELRAARTILNELVHDGQAVGHGRTSGRRYYSE